MFFLYFIVVPHPFRGSELLKCCQFCSKVNRPRLVNQIHFGFINVYSFIPLAFQFWLMNQILHKRLGFCLFGVFFFFLYTRNGRQWPRISGVLCVRWLSKLSSFRCSTSAVSLLFDTKDLGLWFLWGRPPAGGRACLTANLHHQTIHVKSLSVCLQRLCCTNRSVLFSFKCLLSFCYSSIL